MTFKEFNLIQVQVTANYVVTIDALLSQIKDPSEVKLFPVLAYDKRDFDVIEGNCLVYDILGERIYSTGGVFFRMVIKS